MRENVGEMKVRMGSLERQNGRLKGELAAGSQRMESLVFQNNKTISMLSIELSKYER